MLEQMSALLHPSRGAEKAKKQVASEPWNFPNDDSARPLHRVTGCDPPTPRCEDVLPPGTPEEAPSWACLLPAIRVVGRGMEDRVHGGRAALAALQASNSGTSIPLLLTSTDAGARASTSTDGATSPFQSYACSPDVARPQLVPSSNKAGAGGSGGGKGAGRSLVLQDSASSLGPGGSCLNFSSPSQSASLFTPFSSGYALDSPSALLPDVREEGLSPPGSPLGARAAQPRPADLSHRVHGSCSYGDLCQAVMAAAAVGHDFSEEVALYRKLSAPQQRMSRLDSGGLLAALGGL